MNKTKSVIILLAAAIGIGTSADAVAARRGVPANGFAYFPDEADCAYYESGVTVINTSSASDECYPHLSWVLGTQMDNTSTFSKVITVYTNGNGAMGTVCWAAVASADGSASVSSAKTGQLAGAPAVATALNLSAINVPATGSLAAVCQIPYALPGAGYGRIAAYNYAPGN
jgi:hypothetical protein